MSNTNEVELYVKKESAFAEEPSGQFTAQRFSSESLEEVQSTIDSDEIVSAGDTADIARMSVNTQGDIGGPFAHGVRDVLAEGIYRSAWAAASTSGVDLTAVSSTSKITRASGSFITDGWVVGAHGVAAGWAVTANNGIFRVTVVAALELTVEWLTLSDEVDKSGVTLLNSGSIANARTLSTFAVEKKFSDLTNIFHLFKGMGVNGSSLEIRNGQLARWAVSFLGHSLTPASATASSPAPDAIETTKVMNGVDNLTAIREGNTLIAFDVLGVSIAYANNLRLRPALMTPYPVSLGMGRFKITGNVTLYFEDNDMYTKYKAFTESSLSLRLFDAAGNIRIIDVPSIYISSLRTVAQGPDGDVTAEMGFMARRSPVFGYTMRETRIAA